MTVKTIRQMDGQLCSSEAKFCAIRFFGVYKIHAIGLKCRSDGKREAGVEERRGHPA